LQIQQYTKSHFISAIYIKSVKKTVMPMCKEV